MQKLTQLSGKATEIVLRIFPKEYLLGINIPRYMNRFAPTL